jgi:Domain of unknown function (DUF4156)
MQKTFAITFFSAALFSCVYESIVEVKPEGAAVKLVREDEKPFHCKVLGDVRGTSRSNDREKARKGAEADMKNRAAALKANYVVVEKENAGAVGSTSTSDAFMAGKALRCEEPKDEKDKW